MFGFYTDFRAERAWENTNLKWVCQHLWIFEWFLLEIEAYFDNRLKEMTRWYQDERSQDSKGYDRMNSSTWILGQKVSMTKPKADWWSSQDLVSKRSMCNTDHHFQVKTKVSPVNWKSWQLASPKYTIFIHIIIAFGLWGQISNKVVGQYGHWPLRYITPITFCSTYNFDCFRQTMCNVHFAWRRYFHQFTFLAAWTMHFSVKRDWLIVLYLSTWLWVYL